MWPWHSHPHYVQYVVGTKKTSQPWEGLSCSSSFRGYTNDLATLTGILFSQLSVSAKCQSFEKLTSDRVDTFSLFLGNLSEAQVYCRRGDEVWRGTRSTGWPLALGSNLFLDPDSTFLGSSRATGSEFWTWLLRSIQVGSQPPSCNPQNRHFIVLDLAGFAFGTLGTGLRSSSMIVFPPTKADLSTCIRQIRPSFGLPSWKKLMPSETNSMSFWFSTTPTFSCAHRLYGSYEALHQGFTTKALQDLTGGIVQSFSLNSQDRLLTYQVLNSAVPRSTLLIASINIVSVVAST